MNEILANGTIGLLMILLQEENPIFTVLVLRFAICSGAVLAVAFGTSWVLRKIFNMWKS